VTTTKRSTLSDLDTLVEVRATRFVRLHIACRRRVSRARVRLAAKRDLALALLVAAVELRDREHERISAAIARAPSRKLLVMRRPRTRKGTR
jgi:hypothetical protein